MPRLQVEKVHGPPRREIIRGLIAFNNAAVGKSKYQPLTVTLRNGKKIVGGAIGFIWFDWFYLDLLWIDGRLRGKGHGTALIRKAESEAQRRGVRNVFLNTFSFQAPGFYKKLGYREFGRLKNFPAGHTRYFLWKGL